MGGNSYCCEFGWHQMNKLIDQSITPVSQAYKAVGESTEIPLTYYANNVGATVSLLQIMADYGCSRIVYSSSATVYGTPPIIPIPETTRLQADSPYGKTKVMAETIIDDLCHGRLFLFSLESSHLYWLLADKTWRAISLRYFKWVAARPCFPYEPHRPNEALLELIRLAWLARTPGDDRGICFHCWLIWRSDASRMPL